MYFPVSWHAAAPVLAIANAKRLGGHGLPNLYTTWRFGPAWSLLLRLDNTLDKHFELARYDGTAGRSWFAALRYGIR